MGKLLNWSKLHIHVHAMCKLIIVSITYTIMSFYIIVYILLISIHQMGKLLLHILLIHVQQMGRLLLYILLIHVHQMGRLLLYILLISMHQMGRLLLYILLVHVHQMGKLLIVYYVYMWTKWANYYCILLIDVNQMGKLLLYILLIHVNQMGKLLIVYITYTCAPNGQTAYCIYYLYMYNVMCKLIILYCYINYLYICM